MPSAVAVEREYIADRGFHLRGFVGGAVLGTCGLAAIFSPPTLPWGPTARAMLVAVGWMLFLCGLGIRFWSTLYVGGRKVGGRRDSVLVVDGPYSVVRNPLYFGSLLIGLSVLAFLPSLVTLAALLPVVLHYVSFTIPAEEKFLARLVGDEPFRAYTTGTPKLLPRWSQYHAAAEGAFFAKALRNEARRALRISLVPLVLTIVAAARYEPWWPTWFRLP